MLLIMLGKLFSDSVGSLQITLLSFFFFFLYLLQVRNRRSRRWLNDRLLMELVPRLNAEEIRGLSHSPLLVMQNGDSGTSSPVK